MTLVECSWGLAGALAVGTAAQSILFSDDRWPTRRCSCFAVALALVPCAPASSPHTVRREWTREGVEIRISLQRSRLPPMTSTRC